MPSRKRKTAAAPFPALGVDIGGVIILPARKSGDTSFFSSGYLDTPEIEGAIAAIKHLNENVFPGRVFLVSKAKSGTAQKTREWLAHKDFYTRTGLTAEKLHFCDKREGKVPIAKRLGLTVFIDDRTHVLAHLSHIQHRLLFASSHEFLPENRPQDLQVVVGWDDALNLLKTLG